jgi:hypothetical protein
MQDTHHGAGEGTRQILRHRRTARLVVVTRDGWDEVSSAYYPCSLMDALDCLIRGYWGEPAAAEMVGENPDAFELLPEERYGDELDHLAAWLGCL